MRICLLALALLTAGCASTKGTKVESTAARALPGSLSAAVESPYRSPENKLRDAARHPKETLEFFGLEPTMTVIEIAPGTGWYTEILAPYLSEKGTYIAAGPAASSGAYAAKNAEKIDAFRRRYPEVKVQSANFNPPDELNIAPEGSADMVLTFRNVHNWASKNNDAAAFAAFYKALKFGGILGVVEHRANADAPNDDSGKSGYLKEFDVVKMAEKAGFRLVGRSDVNANPKDTKDHPEGVWTLPPSLRLGDKDRAKYVAIGESDRMTLKFKKLEKLAPGEKSKKRSKRKH
ncbi:MAG: methyltransferase [Proteobacteria bacterium]|nr:MAG: methyltransferase [Pseudomonadota bacterium]